MRNALGSSPTHVSTGNVFEDLGFPPEKALALKFKAKILNGILDQVRRKKYRQGKLVELLDEHQPVVSNLLRGKISQMSIEKLLIYADRLGLKLDVHRARPRRKPLHVARPTGRARALGKVVGGKAGGKIGGKRA
jgi:predicted XRE-type DNA-binding protein